MAERQGKKGGLRKKPTKSDPDAEEEKARTAKLMRKNPTTKKPPTTHKHAAEEKAPLPQAALQSATSFVKRNPPTQAATGFRANPSKNRYQDVVCLEETRVILKKEKPEDGDYIHANLIRFHDHDRVYIATRAVVFYHICR